MIVDRLLELSLEGVSHGVTRDGSCVLMLCWDVDHKLCSARYYLDTGKCFIDGVEVDFDEMLKELVIIRRKSLLQENAMYGPKPKPKPRPKPRPMKSDGFED